MSTTKSPQYPTYLSSIYANYLILISEISSRLQNFLKRLQLYCQKSTLNFNIKMTRTMAVLKRSLLYNTNSLLKTNFQILASHRRLTACVCFDFPKKWCMCKYGRQNKLKLKEKHVESREKLANTHQSSRNFCAKYATCAAFGCTN